MYSSCHENGSLLAVQSPGTTLLSLEVTMNAKLAIPLIAAATLSFGAAAMASEGHGKEDIGQPGTKSQVCLLYTSPSPRDVEESRMPSSA